MIGDKWQEKSKLPLTFISFAFIEGKMYRIENNYLAVQKKHKWEDRLYGAIFLLDNSEYYLRVLDGIMGCSMTSLGNNHRLDFTHRITIQTIPIFFNTITEFAKLLYVEKNPTKCITYIANLENTLIDKKVNNTYRNHVRYGFDRVNFINLLNKYKEI